jgi:hypothetical protein
MHGKKKSFILQKAHLIPEGKSDDQHQFQNEGKEERQKQKTDTEHRTNEKT